MSESTPRQKIICEPWARRRLWSRQRAEGSRSKIGACPTKLTGFSTAHPVRQVGHAQIREVEKMKIMSVPDGVLRFLTLLFTHPIRFWGLIRAKPELLWRIITVDIDVHISDEKTHKDWRVC